jgi:hypothetical protein
MTGSYSLWSASVSANCSQLNSENSLGDLLRTGDVNETIPAPEEFRPEDENEEITGATSNPLADPPGSRGHKAKNPYEDTEADDDDPSLTEQLEDNTPANDEQLEGGDEL